MKLYDNVSGELVMSRYVAESMADVCSLSRTAVSLVLYIRSRQRPTRPKRRASVVIDSATFLLTISSPDINNKAMSEPLQHHTIMSYISAQWPGVIKQQTCNHEFLA